jgi:hypothetical protein
MLQRRSPGVPREEGSRFRVVANFRRAAQALIFGDRSVRSSAKGTSPALSERVTLYDVLADGYHTPLTETQIAKLFQAGRIGRNQPCKQVTKKEWRTIDELFPLLKYDSSRQFSSQWAQPRSSRTLDRTLAVVIAVLVTSAGSLAFYFYLRNENHGARYAARLEATARPSTRVDINPAENNIPANTTKPAHLTQSDASSQARLKQERLDAQRQREQVRALKLAQDRTDAARRELAQQNAEGRNQIVPLDRDIFIPDVGVTVKIHDNDATSFDVWINGSRRREVTKRKGISGSRTDETLIYEYGRARLYYVWEISGKLNYCLLRVRDE